MLYIKPLNEISFADIQAFIAEKRRENQILDYKEDWTSGLAKVIAAMANTMGGLILIGVPEEDGNTGMPADKITGVPINRGLNVLRERAVSIAYQAIYPPVTPEVEAYEPSNASGRAIVIIRVWPSDQTPHAIDNRTKVYVRVDSQTQPHLNRLATIDELRWLFDRRKKGEKYISKLIRAAQDRANTVLEYIAIPPLPILEIWIAPKFYFGKGAFSPAQAQSLIRGNGVKSSFKSISMIFPDIPGTADERRSIPTGYCAYTSKSAQSEKYTKLYEYDEVSASGLIYTMLKTTQKWSQSNRFLWSLSTIMSYLNGLLKFAAQSYKNSDIKGLFQVHVSLSETSGVCLYAEDYASSRSEPISIDSSINVLTRSVDISELEHLRLEILKEAAATILWAFGYDSKEHFFESWWSSSPII